MGARDEPMRGWSDAARAIMAVMALGLAFWLASLGARSSHSSPGNQPPELKVDLNTAPPAVLGTLPGVGPSLVHKIVAARSEHPFTTLDDLSRRVKGVGPRTLARWQPFLRVQQDGTLPLAAPKR